ncbi:MAG: hypothetical protein ACRC20_04570 [Segniliparus sp.]|uniref:hypothetical protein n=1 Tax=Segniliparus sp. TaxID=2804064 RepID=UPI003F3590F1
MRRALAGAIAGMCLAAGLTVPSNALADDDDLGAEAVDRSMRCPLRQQLRMQLSPFQIEDVRPDRIPGLSLSLRAAGDWAEPDLDEYGALRQELPTDEGEFASVGLSVDTAKDPETLREMFAHDRREARSDAYGSDPETVVADEDDFEGRPSWFVRTRRERWHGGTLCSVTERSARNVLVEHDGKTYLVQVWGYADWEPDLSGKGAPNLSEKDAPDPDVFDEVADQAANGLAIASAPSS